MIDFSAMNRHDMPNDSKQLAEVGILFVRPYRHESPNAQPIRRFESHFMHGNDATSAILALLTKR